VWVAGVGSQARTVGSVVFRAVDWYASLRDVLRWSGTHDGQAAANMIRAAVHQAMPGCTFSEKLRRRQEARHRDDAAPKGDVEY
jgi:hypothetical protein